jgi:hypothetical protein
MKLILSGLLKKSLCRGYFQRAWINKPKAAPVPEEEIH